MKKLLLFIFLCISIYNLEAQKIAIIGYKGLETTEDGASLLALEDLNIGEVYYFTDNNYNNPTNKFIYDVDGGGSPLKEGVVKITITAKITKGNVIFIKETAPSSSNTFTASVTAGSGSVTAVHVPSSGSFSLGSLGESVYIYTDNDEDPANGVTEIHAAFYPGSGSNANTGGAIPASENPSSDFPNAIIVHNFPEYSFGVDPYFSNGVNRLEYNVSTADRTDVNKVKLENPANYVFAGTNQDLSTTKFTNFNLVTSNPVITLTTSVSQLNENSSSNFIFTFTADIAPTSNLVINFSVNGSSANGIALYGSDYTQNGATTMNTTSGTVTIASETTSKTVVLNPTGDTTLEPDEKIKLSILAGTGYDFGSPSEQTVTITNDDTKIVVPEVAITGLRHYVGTEDDVSEFSFVALKKLTAGASYVFSSNPFDKSTLLFTEVSTYPSELKWTAPSGGVNRGDVIVVKKTALNTFNITRNGSTAAAGTVNKLSPSKKFFISQYGGFFRAHTDTDNNPYNGITAIHSQVFTYEVTNGFGGTMPTSLDLSTLYVGSVLVDGFSNASPSRLEYNPTLRPGTTIDQANFENPTNWLYAQAMQDLSPIAFNNIIISEGSANPKATVAVSLSSIVEDTEMATYTFSLDEVATTDITINFSVSGSAAFSTDYVIAGATSFTETTGSLIITNGTSSAELTLTPVNDANLETTESIQLTITAGTDYDGGSPGSATVNITNDDTDDSEVKLAIIGINHESPSSISLVAMNNILANSTFYFLRNQFDTETLSFQSGGKYKLVTPNTCIPKGTVLTITGDVNGPLTVNCNGTSGSECGTATIIGSGNSFDFLDFGTRYYVFQDSDEDHTNGISQIHSVFHTGGTYPSNHTGGILTTEENPKLIYSNAIVVDGFPNATPNRTEFDASKRVADVSTSLIENTANYVHAQPNALLSTTNFNIKPIAITYVNANTIAGGDGKSWATAYNSLQDALANSLACNNEIWVTGGTYKPHASDQSVSFSIPSNTKIYGGFNGTETAVEQRDIILNSTILSGDLNNSNSSNAGDSHTVVQIYYASNIVLDGFIIEYGYADILTDESENQSESGAGVFTIGSEITIKNSILRNNTAFGNAGAVNAIISIDFYNCLFYNNIASEDGGAIYAFGILNLTNCTLAKNTANNGGGLAFSIGTIGVKNSLFYNNVGINKDIYRASFLNSTSVSYSLFDNSFPEGITNDGNNHINSDPSFVDATNHDYRLKLTSQSINRGNNSMNTETIDLAGNPRKTGTIDLGAYEYDAEITEWVGITNINWDETSNWTNGVPSDTKSAIFIGGLINQPFINITEAEVKDIIITSGVTLTINPGKHLLINRDLELLSNLVVMSDATSSGSLISKENFTGNITYNRYVTDNWHLVSSPVIGDIYNNSWISTNSIASGAGLNRGISTYNNDGLAWEYFQAGGSEIFNSGLGYSTKTTIAKSLSFTGNMATENVSVAISEGTVNKWNLVGNPYPSFINANNTADTNNNFLTVNATKLNPTNVALYFWNSSTSSYDIINHTSGAAYIAPGQGFFVNAIVGGAIINFTEDMQGHQAGNLFLKTTNTTPEINLTISDGATIKTTQIKYLNGTTTGLDPGYDAGVFNGTTTNLNVYSHLVSNSEGVDFALQCLPNSNYENMVIPVGIKATLGTKIKFSVSALNLPDGINVYLEDRETNTFAQLNEANSIYTVDVTKNYSGIGRFYLHTNTSSVLNVDDILLEKVSIYKTTNSSLRITGLQRGRASIKLFDIQGKQIVQQSFNTHGVGVQDISLPKVSAGIYFVQLKTEKGKLNKKIVIE